MNTQKYIMSKVSYEIFEKELRREIQLKDKKEYVKFSGKTQNYCIGFVDIVDSTKIIAKIHSSKLGMYYSIFLNSISEIVQEFGAVVVKNMGDSILFYFPTPVNEKILEGVIECGMTMIGSRCLINSKLFEEKLPSIKYRISVDYGTVSTAFSASSSIEDIFGPPVNVCVKINHDAFPNSMVIGSDLFRMVKHLTNYKFIQTCSFSSGLRTEYLVYSVLRKNS